METLKKIFSGDKPHVEAHEEIGEITILLPKFPDSSPLHLELKNKKTIHLACPLRTTCIQLKIRIRGLLRVPTERIVLFFRGAVIEDDELLPEEVYEQALTENSDDDIFRPRLFLYIYDEDDEVADEDSENQSAGSEDNNSFLGDEEVKAFELPPEVASKTKYSIPSRSFNLLKNLEKIKCDRYADALVQEGFADEGSFSFLTDEILKSAPLYIPKMPRLRILALADATRRRIFKDQEAEKNTMAAQVEAELLETQQIKTKMVEGLDGAYTKKADVKKAWELKQKEEARSRRASTQPGSEDSLLDNRPRKVLPPHVWDKIKQVSRASQRDEFDCLANPLVRTASHWCCETHEKDCMTVHDAACDMRRLVLQADLQVAVDRIDFYGLGFVSRYQLEIILKQQLKLSRLEGAMSAQKMNALLDSCVMSDDEQQWQREWTSEIARESPITEIPLRAYSAKSFVLKAADEILSLELKRLLNEDNTDEI
mmetsp:Transcript_3890/g.6094  ORF Transcript_3890/g.6094 Transcript_3890/m.6094 type:complete len:484 (-) Transcript_3890:59-1510(-)|eukprot:CAMPEP_0185033158 /NCGR_PEP_ID=MMETSP1103-20130426/21878_1 /TAXON_ID=36769 /ORGANISM="Paraphysomonas bandaiensis, Strain Caron Lab Isolate" /LENGTH=483 /DNA_ID=CAMNT_0027569333 /DNA_START=59 /DNA_END=1510 /DNA_ORIENTATION=-